MFMFTDHALHATSIQQQKKRSVSWQKQSKKAKITYLSELNYELRKMEQMNVSENMGH